MITTLNMDYIRPATIAAMIRDLLDYPLENATKIRELTQLLVNVVGLEFAKEYLEDADVTQELMAQAH